MKMSWNKLITTLRNQSGIVHLVPIFVLAIVVVGIITTATTISKRSQDIRSRAQMAINPLPTAFPNCAYRTVTPNGQSNPSIEAEPMGPIWCFPLVQMPTTRVIGTNDWVDEFNTNVQMGRLDNGDMDYRIFDFSHDQYGQSKHFINANHWMVDFQSQNAQTPSGWTLNGGATMRPNRSFTFENGKLVLEMDVAVAIPEYEQGGNVWPEITWSTAPNPTRSIDDGYIYGQFGGHWTSGCRINTGRFVTCALEYPEANIPVDARNKCGAITGGHRMWEISHFQQCGTVHNYGIMPANQNRPWRKCQANQMDIFCRDRLRFEWSKAGLVLYVNGQKFFEDSGWPTTQQLPDGIVNGTTPIYVYFGERGGVHDQSIYRIHWDRIAVNPHDIGDHMQPPTQAPSYCPGQPQDTCPMIMTSTPGSPTVSKNTVDILDYVFSPGDITVEAGTTVTWTNSSTIGLSHSVTSTTGAFDSGIFNPGQKFSYTFNTPGEFPYYCIPHPGMQGKVTVLPKGGLPMPSQSAMATPSVAPTATPSIVASYPATLTPSQETPPTNSTATGTANLILLTDNSARLTVNFSGLTSNQTAAHIHGPAPVGQAAGILVGLPTGQLMNHVITLTLTQVQQLQQGQLYVNIHTTSFPSGEIRGQIGVNTATPTPTIQPTNTPTSRPTNTPTPIAQATNMPSPTPVVVATATPQPQPANTWTAAYYRWSRSDASRGLNGTPLLTRTLGSNLNLNWRWGSPESTVPRNNFSARFTKRETFAGGTYRFTIRNDDGVRVYVDGQLITTDATYWRDQAATTRTLQTNITPGDHTVTVEYYEARGRAQVAVSWIRL